MSKNNHLHLIIPYEEFSSKIKSLITEVRLPKVKKPEDYHVLNQYVLDWNTKVELVLTDSFNIPSNRFEQEYYSIPKHRVVDKSILQNRDDDLLWVVDHKIKWLEYNLEFIKTCDAITDKDFDFEVTKRYKVADKKLLLLKKLYALKDVNGGILQEILEGNGIVISRIEEPLELATELKRYIKVTYDPEKSWPARLTVEGEQYVEENLLEENKEEMETSKSGKIFISHATADKDVASKFCDLILGNGLNIPLKEIFNTSHQGTKPKTGEDFRKRIKDELLNAKVVLQFISKSYKVSEACLNEMGAAWVLSDNVKPLIIEKGEYEVGFIHSTTQQVQLHNEEQLIRLTDELREEGIYEGVIKNEVLIRKVREFVSWLESHNGQAVDSKIEKKANATAPTANNYQKDFVVIKTYLENKGLESVRLITLKTRVNPKYTLEYILGLIEEYPTRFTRINVKGTPYLKLIGADIRNI